MSRLSAIMYLAVAVSLSGCGALELCGNKCNKGSHHNTFECGCSEDIPPSQTSGAQQPNETGQYYIVRHYNCRDDQGRDSGDCIVTSRGNSCQEAQGNANAALASNGDFCRKCNNIIDNSRHTSSTNSTQDGPCSGWTQLEQPHYGKGSVLFGATMIHILRVAETAPKDNKIDTCRSLCAHGSDYCFNVNLRAQESSGLKALQQACLLRKEAHLKSSDLLGYFGMATDPCGRSDTEFVDGAVINTADNACTIKTQIPNSDLEIAMPERLQGIYIVDDQKMVRAMFNDRSTRAKLSFSNRFLEHDWGGDIVSAYSFGNTIGFSVGTTSCVQATLQ